MNISYMTQEEGQPYGKVILDHQLSSNSRLYGCNRICLISETENVMKRFLNTRSFHTYIDLHFCYYTLMGLNIICLPCMELLKLHFTFARYVKIYKFKVYRLNLNSHCCKPYWIGVSKIF